MNRKISQAAILALALASFCSTPVQARFLQTDPIGYKDDLDLYTYVGNDPTDNTDPSGQACFSANILSDYCRRADLYFRLDQRFGAQTRFFGAASLTTAMLADLSIPLFGSIAASSATRMHMANISSHLEGMNLQFAKMLENGGLRGAHLDTELVHKEQTEVQSYLNSFNQNDPSGYTAFISEVNATLNPTGVAGFESNLYSSDRIYQAVLSTVRSSPGRNIDFANQRDREAVGNTLIDKLRSSGACKVTGSRIPQC